MTEAVPQHRMHAAIPVSVILLTYQQQAYVRESLRSLLQQDYPNLQIVISDDASKDNTWAVIEETVQEISSHARIVFQRNRANLGLVGNYNQAACLCDGELVFSAAGDDISELNRISSCVDLWLATGQKFDLIATDLFDMAPNGETLGVKAIDDLHSWSWQRWIHQRPYHVGASHMVTRRMLAIQPLNPQAAMEDQCLLFRALLMGGAMRLPKPLVYHRRGGVSNDGRTIDSYTEKRAKLLASAIQAIDVIDQYLSDARKLDASEQMLTYLTQLQRTAVFTQYCLDENRFLKRLLLLVEFQDVSFSKRMRFFIFSSMRSFFEFMFKIKSLIKRG
jgi:glycosyltransferase involved in cell wall biosynthesis